MANVIKISGNSSDGYSWDCPHCDELNLISADEFQQIDNREQQVSCERCQHSFSYEVL